MNFIETDSLEDALDKLIEECSEVIQACTKIKKYGLSNWHPISGRKNSDHLLNEIEDVMDSIENVRPFIKRPPDIEMVKTVLKWFNNSPIRQQEEFRNTDFDNLVVFMHTLGQQIINYFSLWSYKWDKKIVDDIDESTEHPEAVTLRIIEKVWREVKDAA